MTARRRELAVTTNVHLRAGMPFGVTAFDANDRRGPFVSVDLGDGLTTVSLFIEDEDTANRLIAVAGEARAKLVGAMTRARQAESGQPELIAS
ncbi:MAG: hypothetical protein GEV10_06450 [Streptosporangiales bacterium]|nr:hypothetical protein [Streptosporangiales bacterium]